MKNSKSTIKELLKIICIFFICIIFWVIFFSMLTPESAPDDEIYYPFPHAALILGTISSLIVYFIVSYNSIQKSIQKTKSLNSNIKIYNEKSDKLLDKANRVVNKYMKHESSIQKNIAESRNPSRDTSNTVKNSQDFKLIVENYPELKANESVQELIHQIVECENNIAEIKKLYNEAVENYNLSVKSFPIKIIAKIFKYKEMEFYSGLQDKENLVSDEKLGI